MNISYLPEVVSPTGGLAFPVVSQGGSKKVLLSTIDTNFSSQGNVSRVVQGNNIKLTTTTITKTGIASFHFPGSVYPFPSTNVPAGWLLCQGQEVSRVIYKNLFDVIGVSYGPGDNRITFNLPDLRGRAIVGLETMGGSASSGRLTNSRPGNLDATLLSNTGGNQSHTLISQETGLQSHNHTHSLTASFGGDVERGNRGNGGDGAESGRFPSGSSLGSSRAVTLNYSFTNNAASNSSATSHPNLPPLVFLNWVIKF